MAEVFEPVLSLACTKLETYRPYTSAGVLALSSSQNSSVMLAGFLVWSKAWHHHVSPTQSPSCKTLFGHRKTQRFLSAGSLCTIILLIFRFLKVILDALALVVVFISLPVLGRWSRRVHNRSKTLYLIMKIIICLIKTYFQLIQLRLCAPRCVTHRYTHLGQIGWCRFSVIQVQLSGSWVMSPGFLSYWVGTFVWKVSVFVRQLTNWNIS